MHCTQQSHCLCFIGVVGPGPGPTLRLRHNCALALGDLSRSNPQEPKAPLYWLEEADYSADQGLAESQDWRGFGMKMIPLCTMASG